MELASVLSEFPTLSNRAAFKPAAINLNRRHIPQYKTSRRAIHAGKREPRIRLEAPLFSLHAAPLLPSMADIQLSLQATVGPHKDRVRREARVRIARASKAQLSLTEPNGLRNGHQIFIFHTGVSRDTTGFRGPFATLEEVRSLIVAMRGRSVVTMHSTRVILHKRDRNDVLLELSTKGSIPPARTPHLEVRLLQQDFKDFQSMKPATHNQPPPPEPTIVATLGEEVEVMI